MRYTNALNPMGRASTKKTPAAVLRSIIGIKNQEMAEICGCSVDTIRSVEVGRSRLKLSDDLAMRMFHATGISIDWLLAGNPKAPPVAANGEAYTKEIFEKAQANKEYFDRQQLPELRNYDKLGACAQLVAILENANTTGNYFLAMYKTARVLTELRNEFGQDSNYPNTDPRHVSPFAALQMLEPIISLKPKQLTGTKPSSQQKQQPSTKRRRR